MYASVLEEFRRAGKTVLLEKQGFETEEPWRRYVVTVVVKRRFGSEAAAREAYNQYLRRKEL